MSYDAKLEELGLVLPEPLKPVGSYRPVIIEDGIAYISGQIAKPHDGKLIRGKVGQELSLEQGQEAARVAALNVVSVIKHLIGFDRFKQVLRVVGYVQTIPEFYDIPQVINGASDLLFNVFGEEGVHARSAVGMNSLPLNTAVEIEATVKVR